MSSIENSQPSSAGQEQIAKIPKDVFFDQTVRLGKFRKNERNDFNSGIRISWDTNYGIGIRTNLIEKTDFTMFVYGSNSVMVTQVTEEQLSAALEYIRAVKSQLGKKIDFDKSFQVEEKIQCTDFVEDSKTMNCKICGEPRMGHARDSGILV